MSGEAILTESQELELVAYLVACADTCRREPAVYGPLRLLKGAQRVAALVQDRSGEPGFWQALYDQVERQANWYADDLAAWNAFVDGLASAVAR